jgi:hypothetical protein
MASLAELGNFFAASSTGGSNSSRESSSTSSNEGHADSGAGSRGVVAEHSSDVETSASGAANTESAAAQSASADSPIPNAPASNNSEGIASTDTDISGDATVAGATDEEES